MPPISILGIIVSGVDEFVGALLLLTGDGTSVSSSFASVVSKSKKTPAMSRVDNDAYVLKFCHDMGIQMSIHDIDRSGKIGHSKPRDIPVKFATYRARN